MAANYAAHISTKQTPQSEPVPGKPMVPNNAGGYGFAVDDWTRLDRFLILGSEGGTYYTTERKLTQENAAAVLRCLAADGAEAVRRIAAVSDAGRAPKNDPAVFALALAAAHGNDTAKAAAFAAVPKVCRTGTHLFQFAAACNELRGWGRGLRRAIARWYTEKPSDQLAYQLTKYQQRNCWSHRDLLRLCGDQLRGTNRADLRWAVGADLGERTVKRIDPATKEVKGVTTYPAVADELSEPIRAFDAVQKAADATEAARLIREHRIVRECVPTQFLTDAGVWDALLADMPLTAMLRNLATMTRVGLLTPLSEAVRKVCEVLTDRDRLEKARVHPLAILVALKTYQQGRGDKGSNTWTPVQRVVDALDEAFYLAFDTVEPTGKRWLLALDVSGSMGGANIVGMNLTARDASAAMALVTARTEAEHHVVAFTSDGECQRKSMHPGYPAGLSPVPITPRQRLDDVVKITSAMPMGGTDCALPMLYAAAKDIPVDVFAVYTDSETWAGKIHPFQALRQYREKTGIPAKLIVVGMTSSGFSIADPSDAGMLDVVGFDTAAPAVMADFARH